MLRGIRRAELCRRDIGQIGRRHIEQSRRETKGGGYSSHSFAAHVGEESHGGLERAFGGLPVGEGESMTLVVQHVVRSFDPCMVCTVH